MAVSKPYAGCKDLTNAVSDGGHARDETSRSSRAMLSRRDRSETASSKTSIEIVSQRYADENLISGSAFHVPSERATGCWLICAAQVCQLLLGRACRQAVREKAKLRVESTVQAARSPSEFLQVLEERFFFFFFFFLLSLRS